MKTLLKSLVAIAIVASMLVTSLVVVTAADDNLAAGSTYTIVRLTDGPGSEEEEEPAFVGKGNGDDGLSEHKEHERESRCIRNFPFAGSVSAERKGPRSCDHDEGSQVHRL